MQRFLLPLAVVVALAPTIRAAAPPELPSRNGTPADVFGLTRLWRMHVTISADDWKRMTPTTGFGRPAPKAKADATKPAEDAADRKPRGGFGYDFEYVKGDLEIDGLKFRDVAIRFKGNSSYATTSNVLKRPFKIDLDKFIDGQSFRGVKKLVLNNGVMDTTATRESLAWQFYRDAGVVASRTAFVMLTLTVPGKYDRETVGVYTLIEPVEKPFLKERLGSSKGVLFKPENVGPLDYLGEDWKAYEGRYRPKSEVPEAARRRLMEFTKLVQQADDRRFRAEIGNYLDTDRVLRYIAATVLLASLDSFVGLPHNYYLHLDAKSQKFSIIPWDLDHSFGGLTMVGQPQQLADLSIKQPWLGRNPLVERLLSDATTFAAYRKHLEAMLAGPFNAAKVKKEADAVRAVVGPLKAEERAAYQKRGDGMSLMAIALSMNKPPEVEVFTAQRIASVEKQLAGKTPGTPLASNFGPPSPGEQFVKPILAATDADKNGTLGMDEIREGAKRFFAALDAENKGELDRAALDKALERVVPRARGFGAPSRPLVALGKALLTHAGKHDKINMPRLVAAAESFAKRADRNLDGKLDARELSEALRLLLPPAGRNPPPQPAKERKEARP